MTKTVSAYEARTNLGELLNLVYYKGDIVIIEKMGKPMVKLTKVEVPKKRTKKNLKPGTVNWEALLKASKKAHGILKDYNPEDNPLRRKDATEFLGRWDRDLGRK